MAKGYSLAAFAGIVGVDRTTVTEWAKRHPEFSLAVSCGKAARLRQWETAAMKGAFTQLGGNATLLIFGLKNAGRAPAGEADEWAEKSEVKHSGIVGHYDLSKLTDDELQRVADAEAILERVAISARGGPSGDSETCGRTAITSPRQAAKTTLGWDQDQIGKVIGCPGKPLRPGSMFRELANDRLQQLPRMGSLSILREQAREVASRPQQKQHGPLAPRRRHRVLEGFTRLLAAISHQE